MTLTLLGTKLNLPPAPPQAVRRERLIELLNQSAASQITLISAPAGFGKTTLVSMWAQQAAMPVCWLSLEKEDNDLAHFLAYLIAAFQRAAPELGQDAQTRLQTPQALSYQAALTSLLNDLANLNRPITLVLDDYHLVKAPGIHRALIFLLDHLPLPIHLIIASRADPPLPLPRLRARGQLTELRQRDLRFTVQEAAIFLNQIMDLDLTVGEVSALEARTEGWIAGLQMAALSLQGRSPHPAARSEFVQSLTGSHRFILDYLVEEVLEQQPAELEDFLLKTSILERLSGPLCDWVLRVEETSQPEPLTNHPCTNAQSILEQLEAANMFLFPLDDERRWYRYHRLFADLLQKRLRQSRPDLLPVLHRRASAWHQEQGLASPAIEHALAARDYERAAALIEGNVEATLMRSEMTTFLHWMEKLPDDLVRRRPNLCFFHAWVLLMSGRSLDAVERRLRGIACLQEASEDSSPLAGRMAVLRAYLLLFQGDIHRAAELCRQASQNLPKSDLFLRSITAWLSSLVQLSGGDPRDGKQALQEVARMSQELGNPLIAVAALSHQARLQVRQGRLHRAQEILEQALQLATNPQGELLPIASEALLGLGNLEREWNHLETAADLLTQSIDLAQQWNELASFEAYAPLARVRLAQGDVEAAREALATGRQLALRSEITLLDDLIADLHQAHFAASQGDVQGAMRWAERRGLLAGSHPSPRLPLDEGQDVMDAHLRKYELVVLAKVFILQGRAAEALDLLAPILAYAREKSRVDLIIQCQILRALAYLESHDAQALEALVEALSLAEPGDHLRVFLDEGEPMAELLRQAASRGIASAYVARLLAAVGQPASAAREAEPQPSSAQRLIEPLSERELEVLRLLATGLSNPEIAGELVVAVSTVRSHCKSIYGKLNVHKRWDAVQRAQELGLI